MNHPEVFSSSYATDNQIPDSPSVPEITNLNRAKENTSFVAPFDPVWWSQRKSANSFSSLAQLPRKRWILSGKLRFFFATFSSSLNLNLFSWKIQHREKKANVSKEKRDEVRISTLMRLLGECCYPFLQHVRLKLWPHYIFFSFFSFCENSLMARARLRATVERASSTLLVVCRVCVQQTFIFQPTLFLMVFRLTYFRFYFPFFRWL